MIIVPPYRLPEGSFRTFDGEAVALGQTGYIVLLYNRGVSHF